MDRIEVEGYEILERIGSGGMGDVYLARQAAPLDRTVALKVVKIGMDTREVLARFEAERQALALMDHPGIARVYDAGTTGDGRPFFVMEYVRGVPVTDYCDRERVDTGDRLRLFARICEAVQHAHQRGIIHRDLKPSNILVTLQDGEPRVKIIDFGVAKATAFELTTRTVFTELGQLVGTPEYMSPEQAEMTGLDIDTRSDIYSLGVVLYELLTGTLPFEPGELRAAGLAGIQRILRDTDPPRPSTRFGTLGDRTTETAARRGTVPATLRRQLRGDLDWITMKALDKQRARRYASASEFAADVERHLRSEPVLAGPPTAGYRLGRFVRRNRTLVTSGVVILVLLVAGIAATSWQAVQAERARRAAAAEAATASAINAFLLDLLRQANPHENPGGSEASLQDMIRDAGALLEGRFEDRPGIEIDVRRTLADAHLAVGQYPAAERELLRAREMVRAMEGGPSTAEGEILVSLVDVYEGSDDLVAAESTAVAAEALYRGLGDRTSSGLGDAIAARGRVLSKQDRHAASDSTFRVCLAVRRAASDADSLAVAQTLVNLARARDLSGSPGEAIALHEQAVGILRGADPPRPALLATALNNQGLDLHAAGEYEAAEAAFTECLEIRRRIYPEASDRVAQTAGNLSQLYSDMNRFEEAEPLALESLAWMRANLSPDHQNITAMLGNLGALYQRWGRDAQAEPYFREAYELAVDRYGADDGRVFLSLNNLASALRRADHLDEAEARFRQAMALAAELLGPDHFNVAVVRHNLGRTLVDAGRYAEANRELEIALAGVVAGLGEDHPNVAVMRTTHAMALTGLGRYEEAEAILLAAWPRLEATFGEGHQRLQQTAARLVTLYEAWGRPADAEAWRGRAGPDP